MTEYAAARPSAQYHEGRGVWQIKCDIALPCATQNELLIDDAKALVANGVTAVCEGANMPTTWKLPSICRITVYCLYAVKHPMQVV